VPDHDHHSRRLTWEGCPNARDLGDLPTVTGVRTQRAAIIRSDSPHRLTGGGARSLVDHGVRTIVDLRLPYEAAEASYPFARPGDHGISYVNISFVDPTQRGTTPGRAPLADDYKGMLVRFRVQVAEIVGAIADAPAGGVLIHCAAGKDRTGMIVALLLDLIGVPRELIADDYALSGEYLRDRTQEWITCEPADRAEREAEVKRTMPTRQVMLEVLAFLDERFGGTELYLTQAGLSSEQLAKARTRLLKP
jgi:protein-tyrosine phosphatase